jgi:hypothetical protein
MTALLVSAVLFGTAASAQDETQELAKPTNGKEYLIGKAFLASTLSASSFCPLWPRRITGEAR